MLFSKRLKELMTERKIGIRELEKLSGIGRESIRRRILKEAYVTGEELNRIACAFDLSVNRLVGNDFDTDQLMKRAMERERDITKTDPTLFEELTELAQVAFGATERGRVNLCIGQYFFRLGQLETALEHFQVARTYLEEHEENMEVLCNLFIVTMLTLYYMKREAELKTLYEETESLFADFPYQLAHFRHGSAVLLCRQGDLEGARVLFEQAIDVYQTFEDFKNLRFLYFNWAHYLQQYGQESQAKECFELACMFYAKHALPDWMELSMAVEYILLLLFQNQVAEAHRVMHYYRPIARQCTHTESKAKFVLISAMVSQDVTLFREYLSLEDGNESRLWFARGWLLAYEQTDGVAAMKVDPQSIRDLFPISISFLP